MKSDFFYSKSTGLYVSRKPLKIDGRVKEAAQRANIDIEWDDEGRLNYIDYDNSRKLLDTLEAHMMTPTEYWQVMSDAIKEEDKDMIQELVSNKYAEWLNRAYLKDGSYIDNPKILGNFKYEGEIKKKDFPHGRPGWFNPENNIDAETGMPIKVEINREKYATSWKYWNPDTSVTPTDTCAPIRGYVTSVGKPSWDCGIPADSRQPVKIIRECRYQPLQSVIDINILKKAYEIVESKDSNQLLEFLVQEGHHFEGSYDLTIYKLREQYFDLLGKAGLNGENISQATKKLWKSDNEFSYEGFEKYIHSRQKSLEEALANNKDVVFVMGHKNPDTDTVVSAVFEAWRNHLMNGDQVEYIPVVQSKRMPDEIDHLLGNLSKSIMFTDNQLYKDAKDSGLARWISVDQNYEPEVQKYFISMIDHHIVSDVAKNQDIPKTLEMAGSCTGLITRKYIGMGLKMPEKLAKILYGATLMDTENRVDHKMTAQDEKVMYYLKDRARIENDHPFYQELMSYLLNTNDADLLFKRDYKEDWGFGFAVTKIKKGFSRDGRVLKTEMVDRLRQLAVQNNADKNLPLTLLRVTDYEDDNETVRRERVYLEYNKQATKEFKQATSNLLENIIRFEFPQTNLNTTDAFVEFWGTGLQLSRKKTAPVLEPIVEAFNQYFYSPSIDLWVKRDFLRQSSELKDVYKDLSTDETGRVNYVNYKDVKWIADKLDFSVLSLPEYWQVLKDAEKIKDVQMIDSLQGANFVEFLDTAIVDKKYMINHPDLDGEKVLGEKQNVYVPKGLPGLIHPKDIDMETGIPKKVMPPNQYGNPELWRYWEPDSNLVFPCRSYIFLLGQPCWDGKFHINDSFPNLGVRPVVEKPPQPKVEVSFDRDYLVTNIIMGGDKFINKWPKNISELYR